MATDLPRAVTVRGLTRSFDGRAVVDGLDLSLAAGQFTALLGPSGSGRSTLLGVLAGLDREVSGTVLVPRRRALVARAPRLSPWKRVWRGAPSGPPGPRVSLARALVRDPDLLLLDDPFGALDARAASAARRRVREWWARGGRTVLLVTDDLDEALLLADRVLVMRGGGIAYDTPVALDRPRSPADPAFSARRVRLLAELGVATDATVPQAA
ncbi:ATP-binding cassette domain-containing protein [Streptomyces sp. NBC_01268]|uniref:ATP-binding cassette domain-containing protein n=1 Tax=Streptomyces sp. NBC_01268 TaxID=2903806 RepID=UPI002E3197B0|nr:ATP-binding cassette domain-containing protein [Streptomyces sp. NBC_01268]